MCLGADGAALMRLNPEDGIMSPQAHHGLREEFVTDLRIKSGQVASGRALAQDNPVLVSDTAAFLEVLRANDELPSTMPDVGGGEHRPGLPRAARRCRCSSAIGRTER